jgi:putative spermidine/putrescine transport system substrate-binding protein
LLSLGPRCCSRVRGGPALTADPPLTCGFTVGLTGLEPANNKDLFGDDPPTSTADFLDTERFPGKRMLLNAAIGSVEPLLAADGVEPDQMFPIDWTRVERIINDLGSDFVAQPTLAQMGASLEAGDYAMCLCYTGRTALAIQNGANAGIVWDRTGLGWDMAYAVTGSQAPEAQGSSCSTWPRRSRSVSTSSCPTARRLPRPSPT